MELKHSNWDVSQWVTGNHIDAYVYDTCSAFQKVLDGKFKDQNRSKVSILTVDGFLKLFKLGD